METGRTLGFVEEIVSDKGSITIMRLPIRRPLKIKELNDINLSEGKVIGLHEKNSDGKEDNSLNYFSPMVNCFRLL